MYTQIQLADSEPARQEIVQKLKDAAGKYTAGVTDLAENHDDYLDEIYGCKHPQENELERGHLARPQRTDGPPKCSNC